MAKDKRLTEKQIERLLSNPKKIELEIVKPDSANGLSRRCLTFRGAEKDFDTLNAELYIPEEMEYLNEDVDENGVDYVAYTRALDHLCVIKR